MHLYKVLGEDEQAVEMKRRCALDRGTGSAANARVDDTLALTNRESFEPI